MNYQQNKKCVKQHRILRHIAGLFIMAVAESYANLFPLSGKKTGKKSS